jgi:transcriptional regulator with XRE-family HTH domain
MTTVLNKKITGELKRKRLSLGLTVLELAQRSGVSLMVIQTAEKTDKLFDTLAGRRVARRLKVPVAELVPLTRVRKPKAVAPVVAAVVRPVDFSRGAVLGESKGIAFQKPIPNSVVAVGSLFAMSAS